MTSQWKVLARFKQLVPMDNEEAEKILPLCVINLERVIAQLSDNADKNDIRVINGAAALTYYDYVVRSSAEQDAVTSFKAGDITVSKTASSMTDSAQKIKTDAMLELVPLMKDTRFLFKNI